MLVDREALAVLWGGTLRSFSFDVCGHQAVIVIETRDGGERKLYEITFIGVSTLRFYDAALVDWTYAEVTSVDIEHVDEASVSVRMTLWSEACSLAIKSRELRFREIASEDTIQEPYAGPQNA